MRLLALALLLAAPAAAQQQADAPRTPAEQAAIAQASARGALIYAYDQAAWHGTDDMVAKLPDHRQRIRGWIVEGSADAPRLTFFDPSGTQAVYVARFDHSRLVEGKVVGAGDDAHLTAIEQRLVAALAAARAALEADHSVFRCAEQPFNTVVLPPETAAGPTLVYFLTPQTSNAAIPFGGHYRVEVDAAGHAGPVHAFTRSCLPTPTQPPQGSSMTGMVVSHLIDPVPTEIHVFSSLTAHRRVYVLTAEPSRRLWQVEQGSITGPLPLR